MKAVLLTEPGQFTVGETLDPQAESGEVVIDVAACGFCGTDWHTLEGRNALVRYPVIPGHEFVGTIVNIGADVTRLEVGDRVAVDPSRSCGQCFQCRSGWPNLCPDKGGHGSKVSGGFAEQVVARQEACVALPPDLSWERAVLAEPLACVLHAMDRLGTVLGKSALVYGAGAIGMIAAALLQQSGATVQIIEPSSARRAIATSWGFQSAERASEFDDSTGWDVVVDATGVPAAIEEAFSKLRRAGTFLVLGVAPADARVQIAPYALNWQELTIIGSMAIRHSFQRAVELLPQLDLPLESLITHYVHLKDFGEALSLVRGGDALKVVVLPSANVATAPTLGGSNDAGDK